MDGHIQYAANGTNLSSCRPAYTKSILFLVEIWMDVHIQHVVNGENLSIC